jgi:nucleoside-diphosphate-sugar epimerase
MDGCSVTDRAIVYGLGGGACVQLGVPALIDHVATGSDAQDRLRTLRGSTVLVTGGAGLIGSRITRLLRSVEVDVVVLDSLDAYPPEVLKVLGAPDEGVVVADVTDRARLRQALAGVDHVVHAAALADVAACTREPSRAFASNVHGTHVLLEEVANSDVRRLVFISSASVYGDGDPEHDSLQCFSETSPLRPISVYGNAKAWGENQVRHALAGTDTETVVLRYFSVYGDPQVPKPDSHSWCVAWFGMRAICDLPLVLHNGGSQVRDFIHVDDVAMATALALATPAAAGEVINVGTGVATSVRTVADHVVRYFPEASLVDAAKPLGDPIGGCADIRQLKEILGWQPTVELSIGIERYVEWLRRTPEAVPDWLRERV